MNFAAWNTHRDSFIAGETSGHRSPMHRPAARCSTEPWPEARNRSAIPLAESASAPAPTSSRSMSKIRRLRGARMTLFSIAGYLPGQGSTAYGGMDKNSFRAADTGHVRSYRIGTALLSGDFFWTTDVTHTAPAGLAK